jgi:GTP-binding protein
LFFFIVIIFIIFVVCIGKSSLINALVGKKITIVSNTPGRTQSLHFLKLPILPSTLIKNNNHSNNFYLLDMPGYGFASAPKHLITEWNKLLGTYIRGRIQCNILRCLYLLIDSRRGLMKHDIEMIKFLEEFKCKYQVIK